MRSAAALVPDRYTVLGTLGAGGTGVVLRARDRRLGREVALKKLRYVTGIELYRFKREFRALADIVHPNLVTLHDLHSAGDDWFVAMELVDGVPFVDWVRHRPEEDQALDPPPSGGRRPRAPRSRPSIMMAPLD